MKLPGGLTWRPQLQQEPLGTAGPGNADRVAAAQTRPGPDPARDHEGIPPLFGRLASPAVGSPISSDESGTGTHRELMARGRACPFFRNVNYAASREERKTGYTTGNSWNCLEGKTPVHR